MSSSKCLCTVCLLLFVFDAQSVCIPLSLVRARFCLIHSIQLPLVVWQLQLGVAFVRSCVRSYATGVFLFLLRHNTRNISTRSVLLISVLNYNRVIVICEQLSISVNIIIVIMFEYVTELVLWNPTLRSHDPFIFKLFEFSSIAECIELVIWMWKCEAVCGLI